MKKLILPILALALFMMSAPEAAAQLKTPAPSTSATLMQTVGLTDITIEYSRPSMKGRTIFAADGLVPFGETWRTGANAATKMTFSEDVQLAGKDVKAGSYAVLTVPGASEWKFMLYPYETGNWGSYVEKDPAATFTVKPQNWSDKVETMIFVVDNITDNSADIILGWEKTGVAIPLTVHTDKQVMAQFEKMMAGPSDGDYYAMGSYMHSQGKDLEKALGYVRKVTAKEDARYWQTRREAVILGDMGKYSEAVEVANRSLKGAEEAGNQDYVRMNKASIAEWSAKMKGDGMKKAKSNMEKSKS